MLDISSLRLALGGEGPGRRTSDSLLIGGSVIRGAEGRVSIGGVVGATEEEECL